MSVNTFPQLPWDLGRQFVFAVHLSCLKFFWSLTLIRPMSDEAQIIFTVTGMKILTTASLLSARQFHNATSRAHMMHAPDLSSLSCLPIVVRVCKWSRRALWKGVGLEIPAMGKHPHQIVRRWVTSQSKNHRKVSGWWLHDPSFCWSYCRYFGTCGHCLASNALVATYEFTAKGKEIIVQLWKDMKLYSEIVIATDANREGELIAAHLIEFLRPKVPVKRIEFHAVTPTPLFCRISSQSDLVSCQEGSVLTQTGLRSLGTRWWS